MKRPIRDLFAPDGEVSGLDVIPPRRPKTAAPSPAAPVKRRIEARGIPGRPLLALQYTRKLAERLECRVVQRNGAKIIITTYAPNNLAVLLQHNVLIESPRCKEYDWGHIRPFAPQRYIASMVDLHPRGFILAKPGAGKTRAILAGLDMTERFPLLVAAPLSILSATWAHEVFSWTPHREYAVLHGTADKRRKLLRETEADIYLINYDGIKVILPELIDYGFKCVVFDESTSIKNAGTDRTRAALKLVKNVPYVYGMSGTPTPQSPMDAHGQIKVITPNPAADSKVKFRNMTMINVTQFKWVPRPEANAVVHKYMRPAVRFREDEYMPLPPVVFAERDVKMSPAQAKAYKQMAKDMAVKVQAGEVKASNAGVMLGKLVQICSGFLYDDQKQTIPLNPTARLAEVARVIDETPGKTVLFATHIAAVDLVYKHLKKKGYSVAKVTGQTGAERRGQIFNDFQRAADPRVLVAQERVASHGLTLTEADAILWYSLPTSYETYTQCNHRIHRPGQKREHYVISLLGTPVERELLRRLKARESTQSLLLDMFSNQDL